MILLDRDIIKTNILTKFEENLAKNVVPCKEDISKIWPSDLLFYPSQPIIKLDQDIIKFEENLAKNVVPKV